MVPIEFQQESGLFLCLSQGTVLSSQVVKGVRHPVGLRWELWAFLEVQQSSQTSLHVVERSRGCIQVNARKSGFITRWGLLVVPLRLWQEMYGSSDI